MKVFLYERVSSEEQVKHGYSLEAQDEALKEFCEKHNHVILGVYRDEGISGRKPYTKRPAMVQLLQDVETIKPQMILFTKLDRWFRNIKEYYKVQDILDKYKVDWKAINEDYDTSTATGRLYVNIKLSIAQDEADRTSERIKDVTNQRVLQGKVLGGRVPWGYTIEDGRIALGEVDKTKDLIKHFLTYRSTTETMRYIYAKYGKHYAHSTINLLLRNPILKGEYRGNKAYCEPIISEAEWNEIQSILDSHHRQSPTNRHYLFSGLIRCPKCGRKMSSAYTKTYAYYRCPDRIDCDFRRLVNQEKMESWLLDNVEQDFKVTVTMKTKKKESPQKYRNQLKRLNDIYLLGNISEKEYRKKSADLQQKIASITKETPKKEVFTKGWKDVYKMLDAKHRKAFWQNLIREIHINEDLEVVEVLY